MLKDLDQAIATVGVAAAAISPKDAPEVRVSSADAPLGSCRLEEASAGEAHDPVSSNKRFMSSAARSGAAFIAYLLAGLVGWYLYGVVAPLYASLPDLIAAKVTQKTVDPTDKVAQKSADPVDLLRMTQKMAAEIQALQARLDTLEKTRGAELKSSSSLGDLHRRIDAVKSETGAEIGVLSSRIAQIQLETNTKLAEISAVSHQTERRNFEPVHRAPTVASAAAGVEGEHKHMRKRRGDAFDPSLHPTAPGVPRPLGGGVGR